MLEKTEVTKRNVCEKQKKELCTCVSVTQCLCAGLCFCESVRMGTVSPSPCECEATCASVRLCVGVWSLRNS